MPKSPCEVIASGEIVPRPDWRLAPHWHPFHEIIVVLSGRMHVRIESRDHSAGPGDILFYRAGSSHEEWSDPSHPVRTFFLAFHSADLFPWLPIQSEDSSGRIRQIATWLVEDRFSPREPRYRSLLTETLLAELLRLQQHQPPPWLDTLRHHMREHLRAEITLDDLAQRAGLSRFAFVRKFKKAAGLPPMTELRRMRLEEARLLLLTTSLPVKAIAPLVGLRDEYQLSKLFRAHFRVPPREMRAAAQK